MIASSISWYYLFFIELDALGDDMFLEDDAAYLDEASSAPAVPGTLPGETDTSGSKTKVKTVGEKWQGEIFLVSFQQFSFFNQVNNLNSRPYKPCFRYYPINGVISMFFMFVNFCQILTSALLYFFNTGWRQSRWIWIAWITLIKRKHTSY